MPAKKITVHHLHDFMAERQRNDFYVRTLEEHIREHHFINKPHRHNFYLCVLFTQGKGNHFVDFKNYKVKPGAVFFLSPGQMHHWELSTDTSGFIFFHTGDFYNLHFHHRQVQDFAFYQSIYHSPVLYLSATDTKRLAEGMKNLLTENKTPALYQGASLRAQVDLLYIGLARLYGPGEKNKTQNMGYVQKVRKLEEFIEARYKALKSPTAYAELMNMTRKHLNRICMECMNKTVSEMIADRVMLEAKRLLIHGDLTVAQVADALGYDDHAYFNRFFKKHTGETPLHFAGRQ